jgi:2'-5' RNA ligase superfamily
MQTSVFFLIAALGCATITRLTDANELAAMQITDDKLIAIDILLEPDQTMIAKARAVNARLRGNYPAGYELDATHAPHVTLLQRFVRVKDLDAVTAAVSKVLAAERPANLQLNAKELEYAIWGGLAVTVLVVERTPDLMQLHQKIIEAVTPFSVSGGTAAAFVGADANAETMGWVENFVPKSSGANYIPHVTCGVAPEAFVKQLKAEPFAAFTFTPVGVAVYHLGNFGTAAKKLWQSPAAEPLAIDMAARRLTIERSDWLGHVNVAQRWAITAAAHDAAVDGRTQGRSAAARRARVVLT